MTPTRRSFRRSATAAGVLFPTIGFTAKALAADTPVLPNVLGPRPGYSPQIGTLVSELTWIQRAVTAPVKGLNVEQLDWLLDKNANSIGALLLHLAATETYYGLHTFNGIEWGKWSAEISAKWDPAMELGDSGRKVIKGHDLTYYLDILKETREKSLAEFRKRDDTWLLAVDQKWPWGPTNNLCKWFHVCEHESHHAGQIDLLIRRTPGYVEPK
jgi:hypothetical protein